MSFLLSSEMSVLPSGFVVYSLRHSLSFQYHLSSDDVRICIFSPDFSLEFQLSVADSLKELSAFPYQTEFLSGSVALQLLLLIPSPRADAPPQFPSCDTCLCTWHDCHAIFSIHRAGSHA